MQRPAAIAAGGTAALLFFLAAVAATAAAPPSVIIVGAGFSGISAAKTLWEAGVEDLVILEATDRIGGRIRSADFAGLRVEKGANWVQGVGGKEVNPIWPMAEALRLRRFLTDFDSAAFYKQGGGLYKSEEVQEAIQGLQATTELGRKLSARLPPSGRDDISLLTMQRLADRVPTTPLDMALDYYQYDYDFAEPPRVTSMQNTVSLPTYTNFGPANYFVADKRGFASVVHYVACQFLSCSNAAAAGGGTVTDERLKLNQVVRRISYTSTGVAVETENHHTYKADYVVVSASIGVLQSGLIAFQPRLPSWKIIANDRFDMAVYTKIYVSFPSRFWPTGNGTQFFLYASERRGYYPVWQSFEREYPGANVLLVVVTDDESRRIEQQEDSATKAEIMGVLREMFGAGIPEATGVFVPRWWKDRFFKGSYSNWPIGVSRYEFDQIRAPVGRVYFTGEHTSELYNGYVHGAYLAGIESANMLIKCIKTGACKVDVRHKDAN